MSNYDYEVSSAGQQKSGSVLPWILLTIVAVVAGVGMVAFNSQKDQAMTAMDHYKTENDSLRKQRTTLDQAREDLEKQLTQSKADRDDMEKQKTEAQLKLDQANQQIALLQKEGSGKKSKPSKPSKRGHHRR